MKLRKSNFWRINEQVRGTELRVIDEQGKQVGVIPKEKALELAKQKDEDLIEIAPNANPPVAKIISFGKFRYQEEKKERELSKKTKTSELKEVRFSPFIAENDFQTRFSKVKGFLDDKNKVKLTVVFTYKQLAGSKRFGYDILAKITNQLKERISIDMQPKFLGKYLTMIISPKLSAKKEEK